MIILEAAADVVAQLFETMIRVEWQPNFLELVRIIILGHLLLSLVRFGFDPGVQSTGH